MQQMNESSKDVKYAALSQPLRNEGSGTEQSCVQEVTSTRKRPKLGINMQSGITLFGTSAPNDRAQFS